jgi:hydroxymethylbilane synthase
MATEIRIGTRASALALAQADIVKTALSKLVPHRQITLCPLSTEGDQNQHSPLSELGGKGVFIKSIERALKENCIDIAVHSLKDVTSSPDEALILAGFLKAESTRDVLIGHTLATLPKNGTIGTGSLRRQALIKQMRSDIIFKDIRGNIDTRIQKISPGVIDAIILSEVGLIRLGKTTLISETLDPHTFFPAPGQGVITLQTRKDDAENTTLCKAISDPFQTLISETEFTLLQALGFNCRIPLGVLSLIENKHYNMTIFIADKTLKKTHIESFVSPIEDRFIFLDKAILNCKKFLL